MDDFQSGEEVFISILINFAWAGHIDFVLSTEE